MGRLVGRKRLASQFSRCPSPPDVADKAEGAGGEQGKSAGFGRDVQHEVLVVAAALHGKRCRVAVDRAAEVAPQAADRFGVDQRIGARPEAGRPA